MKKIIAASLILIIAVSMVTVSASPAGSPNDPLISRRYLEGAYADLLRADIADALESVTDQAIARLDDMYMEAVGYTFARRFTPVSISAGHSVSLGSGSSFILLSGAATLQVNSGAVINVSTGSEVPAGTALAANQRFFCTESTRAVVTASSAVSGYVDGFFNISTDPSGNLPLDPPHHVPLPFTDVPSGAWFRPAIEFVFNNNLFAGTSATTFSPNTPMTRGMFVTVLHRLDGLPPSVGGVAFSDVRDPSAFFYDAVAWAGANNIVGGFEDGTFRPNQAVTREQMASIMHRYASLRGRDLNVSGTALDPFPDRGNVSGFALTPMSWAVTWEIIRGTADGNLMPRSTATRAEVAQIILNYNRAA